ncbi:branched-chain amino acid ABC transporter permease [Paracoccus sp. MBLB3053]|uniref:Branched-chain amino acid ABC transporter permease n=1 Tax=Paracoccus aurantius TaxID=3073814 RepID=A0ABU2HX75_9RHOB|nr:branched-chain amino acid ABC transporter permease [Paracoccus sp. MBLB3053]MDS9469651.1 branched-chain amino acid ABC transporter permease [Paracoccus sp. MBLB3053]
MKYPTVTSGRLGMAAMILAAAWALIVVPSGGDMTLILSGSIYCAFAILALSLALIWGFSGILSFGQTAFFGIGGYAYAVLALNIGDTTAAALLAILVAAAVAAAIGYFMFWGRLGDVYLGVITLVLSLILYRFINQTSGSEWKIGKAPLGGFNGIPSTPILTDLQGAPLWPEQIYVLCVLALILSYVICRLLLATGFGRVVVALRENELRAELLGYDTRLYKLGAFCISGGLAGLAGVLFANCVFVSPNMFSLATSSQLLVWVIVGGLGTLAGPVIACFLLLAFSNWLGTLNAGAWLDPNLVMGLVLTLFVLVLPKGILPLMQAGCDRLLAVVRHRSTAAKVMAQEEM